MFGIKLRISFCTYSVYNTCIIEISNTKEEFINFDNAKAVIIKILPMNVRSLIPLFSFQRKQLTL